MTFSHKNRKGQTWYLFEGRTKTGKPRYFLSQTRATEAGRRMSCVPKGHEIYEKPNGQVFCRKALPVLITDDEVALVKRELAKHRLASCIVERKGEDLIIHEPQGSVNLRELTGLLGFTAATAADFLKKTQHYHPVLKFQLVDDAERRYTASRWCFLGGIDDWFSLDCEKTLAELAKKYVKHIGKESFYELL